MATTIPKIQMIDFAALIQKHTNDTLNIDQHFTPEELCDLSEHKKVRLRNVKRNYLMLIQLGIPANPPDFMQENTCSSSHDFMESNSEDKQIPGTKAKTDQVRAQSKKTWSHRAEKVKRICMDTQDMVEMPKQDKQKKTQPKQRLETRKAIKRKSLHAALTWQECFAESDADFIEFAGFSISDIGESVKRSREQTERNDALISQLKNDCVDLDTEEEEAEETDDKMAVCENGSLNVTNAPELMGTVKKSRYPRRNVARMSYKEQRVPKVCDDCDQEHKEDSPIQGPLITIEDIKVPNERPYSHRAVQSLPIGLVLKHSEVPAAGDGVWTEMDMAKGQWFGPYEGIQVKDRKAAHQSGYCWQIYHDGDIMSHYVDAQYSGCANWLCFVNCARNEMEQNLLAYQHEGNIFYKTTKPISKGTELLVWYGDEYAKELGITEEELHALYRNAGFEVWACEVCGTIFPSSIWLLNHKRHHDGRSSDKRYKCGVEDFIFTADKISLKFNQKITRTGEKSYRCTVCSYRAARAEAVKRHMRTHTGEKPYRCTVCSYRAARAEAVKRHMRTHTGEKPYRCTVCSYRAARTEYMKRHMRTHTGEKPYKCTVCSYRGAHAEYMKRHMRTHTGEKPHKCTVCSYRTADARALKRHMRTHAGKKNQKTSQE